MNGNGKHSVNFDSRIFSIEPWNGIPSEWFVRVFLPEVHGWLHGQGDEFYSLHEHVVDQTAYGCVNEPMPRPATGCLRLKCPCSSCCLFTQCEVPELRHRSPGCLYSMDCVAGSRPFVILFATVCYFFAIYHIVKHIAIYHILYYIASSTGLQGGSRMYREYIVVISRNWLRYTYGT